MRAGEHYDRSHSISFEPAASCPPLAQLVEALSRDEFNSRHSDAARHLERCPRCRAGYLLQQDFQNAMATPEEAVIVDSIAAQMRNPIPISDVRAAIPIRAARKRILWTPRFFAGIAAAAVISIIAVGVRERSFNDQGQTTADNAVYRSATVQAAFPIGDLQKAPEAFRWTAASDAHRFAVTVMEVDGTVVYQSNVNGTTLKLPARVRSLLQPGRTLLWNVKALDASGHTIQESKVEQFRVIASHSSEHR